MGAACRDDGASSDGIPSSISPFDLRFSHKFVLDQLQYNVFHADQSGVTASAI
jgi:hypothetical protein